MKMNGFHKLIRNLSCTAMCSLPSSHLCLNSMEKQTSDFPFSVKKSQKGQGGETQIQSCMKRLIFIVCMLLSIQYANQLLWCHTRFCLTYYCSYWLTHLSNSYIERVILKSELKMIWTLTKAFYESCTNVHLKATFKVPDSH